MALVPLRVNPPLKGVNTTTPIRELTHEYAVKLDNIWIDKAGSIQRRPGQNTVIAPFANSFDMLFEYVLPSGASIIFAHDSVAKTIVRKVGNIWAAPENIGGVPITFNNVPSIAQMGGQMIIGDGTTTAVFNGTLWNITVTGIVAGAYNNNCKFFTIHGGRCYAAGSGVNSSVVFFSDALADGGTTSLGLSDWTIGATGPGGFIDVSGATGRGEIITGLATIQGMLIVFCSRSIVFYNIYNPLNNFTVQKVIHGVGCASHESISGTGNDLIFLSHYGFLKISEVLVQGDAAVSSSSIAINNFIAEQIAGGAYNPALVRSAYVENLGIYVCSFGITATWVYHELFGGWTPWFGIQPQLLYTSDNLFYSCDAELLQLKTTNNTDITTAAGTTPITYIWETAPFRSSGKELKARWNRAELIYEAAGNASYTLTSWLNLDMSTAQVIVTAVAPTNVIIDNTGLQWSQPGGSIIARTKWGGVGATPTKWGGSNIIGNTLLAGDSRVPLLGFSEIMTISISNSDQSYFRISALEVYRNDGGLR